MPYRFNPFTGQLDDYGSGGGSVSIGLSAADILSATGSTINGVDGGVTDRIVFWDDSAGKLTYLDLGTNLSITGTTLNATGGGGTPGGTTTQVQFNNAGAFAGDANFTWSGTTGLALGKALGISAAGAASTPAEVLSGAWFSGGTGSTTTPHLLLQPSGTTSSSWSTGGTGLGLNAATGFAGNLVDLQQNGTSRFSVSAGGAVTAASFSGSGASLTGLTAGNLSGTIPSAVLGNSSLFVGTTSVALNRASANLALTGISSIALPGATSGTVTLTPAAVAGTTSITLPATTGTLVTTGDSGSVTNAMIAPAAGIPYSKLTLTGTIVDADISASAAIAASKIVAASTTGAGVVQLTDSTATTSSTLAATATAVKSAFDLANAALASSGGAMTGPLTLNAQNQLRLADLDSSNYVGFQSPSVVGANVVWTLPAADGSSGQVLSTNGTATLSWATALTAAANNAFTGANTFTNATGQTFRNAATQDGIILAGRAGGTTSLAVTLIPGTLTLSRTLTLPDVSGTVVTTGDSGSITNTMVSASAAIAYSKLSLTNSIVNGDIAAAAGIVDTKLATISTAGKVSGTAITSGNISTSGSIATTSTLAVGQSSAAANTDLDVNGTYAQVPVAVAALAIDCSTGNHFTKTIAGNSTFTVANVPASRAYSFTLELTHTSGTITWFAGVVWPGDIAPTLTTGKTHLFMFSTVNGGTRWRATSLVNYTT